MKIKALVLTIMMLICSGSSSSGRSRKLKEKHKLRPRRDELVNSTLIKFDFTKRYTSHPMLFYSAKDEDELRYKAQRSHNHILGLLGESVKYAQDKPNFPPKMYKEFAGHWNEMYGNMLPPMALYCVLKPEDLSTFGYVRNYMDRMAKYKNWRVLEKLKDEVPLGHNVAGFAIALDFIYERLDTAHQEKFMSKLINQTRDLYKSAPLRTWGNAHLIQNHVATNVIAILIGALVSREHTPEAEAWLRYSISQWEKTMDVLELVVDGSLTEGVGYGGYTFRSMCQYIFLVQRHFNFDHSTHPWLRKHFEFYYYTTIPGFHASVGIADSRLGWFYGPEASLYFLDTFVLRDGSATWLADNILQQKIKQLAGRGEYLRHNKMMLHLAFLFFDETLIKKPPVGYKEAEFHYFSDWGVVTYRSGPINVKSSTFMSFKSSKIHGNTVWDMVHNKIPSSYNDWKFFNPGHEHADQNSFTFLPYGVFFITEQLYAPKIPYLDNVHMFYPSPSVNHTKCTPYWAGQLGTCEKWLIFEDTSARGEVLYTDDRDGFAVAVGDSAKAYDEELGLSRLLRGVILLAEDILLVIDSIQLEAISSLTHVSAFFNNHEHYFIAYANDEGLKGFAMKQDGMHTAIAVTQKGQTHEATIKNTSMKYLREKFISNANLTFTLEGAHTNIAYLFTGPRIIKANLSFVTSVAQQNPSIVTVYIDTEEERFVVTLNTEMTDKTEKPVVISRIAKSPLVLRIFHRKKSFMEQILTYIAVLVFISAILLFTLTKLGVKGDFLTKRTTFTKWELIVYPAPFMLCLFIYLILYDTYLTMH